MSCRRSGRGSGTSRFDRLEAARRRRHDAGGMAKLERLLRRETRRDDLTSRGPDQRSGRGLALERRAWRWTRRWSTPGSCPWSRRSSSGGWQACRRSTKRRSRRGTYEPQSGSCVGDRSRRGLDTRGLGEHSRRNEGVGQCRRPDRIIEPGLLVGLLHCWGRRVYEGREENCRSPGQAVTDQRCTCRGH